MHFISVATLIALVALVQAFTIPEGTADGVYAVAKRADGTDEHIKMASAASHRSVEQEREASASLESRADGEIWCGCGFNMNTGNCDAAVADIKKQMGGLAWVDPGQSYYSIRGDVVAFACGRGNSFTYLNGDTFGVRMAQITNACGRYIAGAYQQQGADSNSYAILGYQRYKNGDDFCATSTISGNHHC